MKKLQAMSVQLIFFLNIPSVFDYGNEWNIYILLLF